MCVCSLLFCIWPALNICLLQKEINEWLPLESKHFQTVGHKTGGNADDLIGYEPDPLSYNLKDPIWKHPFKKTKKRHKQSRKRSGPTEEFQKLGITFNFFQLISRSFPEALPNPTLRSVGGPSEWVSPSLTHQAQDCGDPGPGHRITTDSSLPNSHHISGMTPQIHGGLVEGCVAVHGDWRAGFPMVIGRLMIEQRQDHFRWGLVAYYC